MFEKDKYTVSLLHFNDPNNPWKDECGNKWTTVNNAGNYIKYNTSAQKFGKGCYHQNGGSKTYLHTTNINAVNLFSGNFTIEFWIKLYNLTSHKNGILASAYPANDGFTMITRNRKIEFIYKHSGNPWDYLYIVENLQENVWYYLTISKSSNVFRVFMNGNIVYTKNINAIIGVENNIVIGWWYRDNSCGCFYGYINEFRLSNIARYVENFNVNKLYETPVIQSITKRNIYHLYNISYDSLYKYNINDSLLYNDTFYNIHNKVLYNNDTLRDINKINNYNNNIYRNILKDYIYNNNIHCSILRNYIYNNNILRDINKINVYNNNILRNVLYNINSLYDTYRYIKRINKYNNITKRNIINNIQVLYNIKRLIHNNINIINYIYRKKILSNNINNDTVRSVISWKHKIITFVTNPRYKLK